MQHGYAVAAPQYRLSGEAKFPAQVCDLNGSVRWLRANAQAYRLDTDRIAGWGASAGAFLISLVALTDWEGDVGGNLDQSSRLQAVVAYFMVSDLHAAASPDGEAPTDQMATNLLGYKVRERPDAAREASPINHVRPHAPPFLIMHGTADPTVAFTNGLAFYNALRYLNKKAVLLAYPGEGHGLRGMANRKDLTIRYFQFFDHYLKDAAAPKWMTDGVPFLDKDANRDPRTIK